MKRIASKLPESWQSALKGIQFGHQIQKGTFVTDEQEYGMLREWVDKTIGEPDDKESKDDGTIHYLKAIQEFEGRI